MWDNSSKEANYTFTEKRMNKRKRNVIKLFAVSVTILIILGICGSVAYNSGYIPIKRFMAVKRPIGEADEINIDEHINKHPELKEFPYLDKIKYKVYGTNRSTDTVSKDYKRQLGKEGYKVLYEGKAYKDEIPFQYYGFLKGLTGVGIVITSDENITLNYETMVLYTTGSAFDYREILRWYKENNDLIGDIYL
jgi:hypothetical protein